MDSNILHIEHFRPDLCELLLMSRTGGHESGTAMIVRIAFQTLLDDVQPASHPGFSGGTPLKLAARSLRDAARLHQNHAVRRHPMRIEKRPANGTNDFFQACLLRIAKLLD